MIVKNVEKKEHSTAVFQVEVEADVFEKATETAYKRARGSINVAGFRKGKAPRAVVEGMYGKQVFHEDAVQILAPDAFEFAVGESGLEVVGSPSLIDFEVGENNDVTVTFLTDVYPEVTLGEYKGLEAEGEEVEISEAAVDVELDSVRRRNARMVDVDRPVQDGDTIVLDFEGFVDGVPFEGGKAEGYSLEIGSETFIPGFEEQLVGMTAGTDGEVNVTFPEKYDDRLAGREAVFKVKISAVREPQYPDLDDEFAKDVSEFDTFAEYREDLRANMLKEAQEQADQEFKTALMLKAVENMTCEVPAAMINDKIDEFLRSYANNMGIPARSPEEVLKMMGIDEKTFSAMVRPNAEKQAQMDVLLDAVVKAENIEVPQEEKDEFYKKIDEEYGEDAERVKKMIDEKLMVRDLSRQKAAELIYSCGVKVAPAPVEEVSEENTEEKQD